VSDDELRRAALESGEADFVHNRIRELRENPLLGDFDAKHLQATHAYFFQDVPHHHPGIIREDTDSWVKHRVLEGKDHGYEVAYLARGVEARIKSILDAFGGPAALQRLTLNEAAAKLARLYGDLDYAHGFYEGNSRTLREFTRTLAAEAGLRLDWSVTLVSAVQRNALYAARDLEVIARHYPGMTPDTATTPREHYATIQAENFRKTLGEHPLEDIIRAGLTPLAALKLAITDHRKTATRPQ
jgi:fido (protein-threonine AMPylation protein)